jgi:hypothetical protein
MAGERVHGDDTHIRVLDRDRRVEGLGKGVKQGRIWTFVRYDRPWAGPVPPTIMQRLLERIEDEACLRRARDTPADNAASIDVDDERHMNKARPGGGVGEVADPERIRRWRLEVTVHVTEQARNRLVAKRRPRRLAADAVA